MEKPKLLIVEDDESIRSQMKWALCEDYEVLTAEKCAQALEATRRESPAVVLLDLGLPPSPRTADEGLKCLREIQRIDSGSKVIVVTGNQEKENAFRAIEQGAFDYFLKPAQMEELKVVLRRALHLSRLERERVPDPDGSVLGDFEGIIGESPQMQQIYKTIRKVAPTDAPVLIEGESGTGKEMVAKAIHRLGDNDGKAPFVAINCGAIPENLLESELFGHEKGSFTGADSQRRGKIEYANGGTLFLDEIGELPLLLQVKILRFLQELSIERVGGRETIPVNARVVAATNRDLQEEIREGRFREDLFYRLSVVAIHIPPLRERGEDVLLLANYFLQKSAEQYDKKINGFGKEAVSAIVTCQWPGNVRELENRIRRGVILCERKQISPVDLNLPSADKSDSSGESLEEKRAQVERAHIRKTLEKHGWNITRAAEELGISRPTLYDRLKRHGIRKRTM